MDMSLSELLEMLKDRQGWHAVVHGVAKSYTRLSDWTTNEIQYLFICLLNICVTSLEKCLIKLFAYFSWIVFLLLSYKSFLYILDTSHSSDIWLETIFFHSMGYLFTFLMVSFEMQKILIFVSLVYLSFSFILYTFNDSTKESLHNSILAYFYSLLFAVIPPIPTFVQAIPSASNTLIPSSLLAKLYPSFNSPHKHYLFRWSWQWKTLP